MKPFVFARLDIGDDDLVTMTDIAGMIGLSYQYIRSLACGTERSRVPFPEAFTQLGGSKLWLRSEILRWGVESKRISASDYADMVSSDDKPTSGTVIHESPPVLMDWPSGGSEGEGTVLGAD